MTNAAWITAFYLDDLPFWDGAIFDDPSQLVRMNVSAILTSTSNTPGTKPKPATSGFSDTPPEADFDGDSFRS
jgi:hypothetical protein